MNVSETEKRILKKVSPKSCEKVEKYISIFLFLWMGELLSALFSIMMCLLKLNNFYMYGTFAFVFHKYEMCLRNVFKLMHTGLLGSDFDRWSFDFLILIIRVWFSGCPSHGWWPDKKACVFLCVCKHCACVYASVCGVVCVCQNVCLHQRVCIRLCVGVSVVCQIIQQF